MFDHGQTVIVRRRPNMVFLSRKIAPKIGWLVVAIVLAAPAASAQTLYGADVLVSNGKRSPTETQLEQILTPGGMIRDMLGWHKADPNCDLVSNPTRQITIPAAMMTLYQNVEAVQRKIFVPLGFSNN